MNDEFERKVAAFIKFRHSVHRAGERHKVQGLDFVMALSSIITHVILQLPEEKREGALQIIAVSMRGAVEAAKGRPPEAPLQ